MLQNIVFWVLKPFVRKIICADSQQNLSLVPLLNSKCKDPKGQNELRTGFIWHKKMGKWSSSFMRSTLEVHYIYFIADSQGQREDKKSNSSWVIEGTY